jgi:hypothetical protein
MKPSSTKRTLLLFFIPIIASGYYSPRPTSSKEQGSPALSSMTLEQSLAWLQKTLVGPGKQRVVFYSRVQAVMLLSPTSALIEEHLLLGISRIVRLRVTPGHKKPRSISRSLMSIHRSSLWSNWKQANSRFPTEPSFYT